MENDIKEVVLCFIDALNNDDFTHAKDYISDDMVFVGAMGTRNGGQAYISDMEKMRLKYDIKKTFADGNDVCLWYNIAISGQTIFASGWYHVENYRILSIKVVFDPRPLLEAKK